MTFEDAIRKAIKAYFKGKDLTKLDKVSKKPRKYTKDYFDKVGEEYVGKEIKHDV